MWIATAAPFVPLWQNHLMLLRRIVDRIAAPVDRTRRGATALSDAGIALRSVPTDAQSTGPYPAGGSGAAG